MLKEEPYTQKEADAASGMGAQAFYLKREKAKNEAEGKMDVEA